MRLRLAAVLLAFVASRAGASTVEVSASIAGEDATQTKYNVAVRNTGVTAVSLSVGKRHILHVE